MLRSGTGDTARGQKALRSFGLVEADIHTNLAPSPCERVEDPRRIGPEILSTVGSGTTCRVSVPKNSRERFGSRWSYGWAFPHTARAGGHTADIELPEFKLNAYKKYAATTQHSSVLEGILLARVRLRRSDEAVPAVYNNRDGRRQQ